MSDFRSTVQSLLVMMLVLQGWGSGRIASAQPAPPAGESAVAGGTAPLLRLAHNGPLSAVTALALSPNGQVLYAGGWDKVVHVWTRQKGVFVYDPTATYRIPVGGGLDGGINTLAISDDGQWLAVAGRGAKRGVAGQRDSGYLVPVGTLSPEAWLDEGQIYVLNTKTRTCMTLRGHPGAVVNLAFAPVQAGVQQTLVSVCSMERGNQSSSQISAWNIETGKRIGNAETHLVEVNGARQQQPLPKVDVGFIPQPVPFWAGKTEQDLRVAVTWGTPGFGLRIWNVRETTLSAPISNDPLHYFTIEGHEADQRITASGGNTRTGNIELGSWSLGDGRRPLDPQRDYRLLLTLKTSEYVTKIAASTKEFGRCLLMTDMQQQKSKLLLLDQSGKKVVQEHPLWDGLYTAAFARALREGTVAVCRAGTSDIQVFNAADLQRPVPPQTLRISFPELDQITFVNNGKNDGLQLKLSDGQNVVFDFSARAWEPVAASWESRSLVNTDWTVLSNAGEKGHLVVTVKRPDKTALTIDVQSRVSSAATPVLTASAVFPGTQEHPIPLFVCALRTSLVPELQVYDLRNGEQIRQLTFHTGLIRAVTLSNDGRLVGTISDDRTCAIWRISDFDQQLGQHGLIRSGNDLLKVEAREGQLFVTNAIAGFKPDMQLIKMTASGSTRDFSKASGKDFYQHIHSHQVGDAFVIQTSQGDVQGVLGEAISDHKPLFSLFVAPVGAPADWKWIGWHPLGLYEASDRLAEASLGWHFNTGNPTAPTRFAAAEGYRDDFETPHLMEYLYRHETVPDRPLPPPPSMSLLIQDQQEQLLATEFDGLIPVNTNALTAILAASGSRVMKKVAKVEFVLLNDEGKEQVQVVTKTGQDEWIAPLKGFAFSRGRNRFTARITTNETPPRVFTETVGLRYQPLPPQVRLPASSGVVAKADHAFAFQIVPSTVPAEVLLRHRDAKGNVLLEQKWPDATPTESQITQKLKLVSGLNQIEVTAWNAQALYGFESSETTTQMVEIPYEAPLPPDPPKVAAVISHSGQTSSLEKSSGGEFETDSAAIQLAAQVKSTHAVIQARVVLNDQELAIDELNSKKGDLTFSKALKLQPGLNIIRCVVESGPQERGEFQTRVNYRPQLPFPVDFTVSETRMADAPTSTPTALNNGEGELVLTQGVNQAQIQIQSMLEDVDPDRPFDVQVVVDDQPRPQVAVVREGNRISAKLDVVPGSQRVQFRLSNAWHRRADTPAQLVTFRRPPKIDQTPAATMPVTDPKLGALEFIVIAPEELPPRAEQLRVVLNEQRIPCDTEIQPLGGDRWKVIVRNLILDHEGENRARIDVGNQDGNCLQPALLNWTLMIPPKEKPVISVLDPGDKTKLRSIILEFSVKSDSPLQAVKVERMIAGIPQTLANASGTEAQLLSAEKSEDGSTVFRLAVQLATGQNHLLITAANEGGTQSRQHDIACTPVPIQLEIQSLGTLQPERIDEQLSFKGALPAARNELIGFVDCDLADPDQRPPEFVQFWVNGFLQQSVALVPVTGRSDRWQFKTSLVMTRKQGNQVEMSIPDYTLDEESLKHARFWADCDKPQTRQSLQLLIVGGIPKEMAPPDYREMLESRAQGALAAKIGPEQKLESSAFSDIDATVLTGRDATYGKINSALIALPYKIHAASRRKGGGEENVVLVIYYHGRETPLKINGREAFTLSTPDTWNKLTENSRRTENLNQCLNNIGITDRVKKYYGAHLLFLDVDSTSVSKAGGKWPDDPHLGIVRTVWNDSSTAEGPRLMNAMAASSESARQLGEILTSVETGWKNSGPAVKDFSVPDVLRELQIRGN